MILTNKLSNKKSYILQTWILTAGTAGLSRTIHLLFRPSLTVSSPLLPKNLFASCSCPWLTLQPCMRLACRSRRVGLARDHHPHREPVACIALTHCPLTIKKIHHLFHTSAAPRVYLLPEVLHTLSCCIFLPFIASEEFYDIYLYHSIQQKRYLLPVPLFRQSNKDID